MICLTIFGKSATRTVITKVRQHPFMRHSMLADITRCFLCEARKRRNPQPAMQPAVSPASIQLRCVLINTRRQWRRVARKNYESNPLPGVSESRCSCMFADRPPCSRFVVFILTPTPIAIVIIVFLPPSCCSSTHKGRIDPDRLARVGRRIAVRCRRTDSSGGGGCMVD